MGNDGELLESWRSGNQRAGEILLSRYFDSLFRFFASKVDGSAEALIQRSLLACVERTDDASATAGFRSYLYRVAREELYAHLDGKPPAPSHKHSINLDGLLNAGVLHVGGSSSDAVSSMMVERQEQRLVLKGLRKMPMDLQIVLGLFYWEKLSPDELAHALDSGTSDVKALLGQAREALEEQLRALAPSTELRRSTIDNLDAWVSSLAAEPK